MKRPWRIAKRILVGLAIVLLVAAVAGAGYQWLASRNDLAATPPPGTLVDVGGHRLHLWCVGEAPPRSPTVLFESGLGGDAFDWAAVAPQVAGFTQACTYDRAGMGYSDEGPTPRTSGQIAAELAALIENSEISKPVILVALSFGGFNTRIVASDYPERAAAAGIPSGKPPDILLTLGPLAASVGILRLAGVTLASPPDQADPSVREFIRATAYRTSRYYAMASELAHTTESGREVASSRRQLTIPLAVVSPARGSGIRGEINEELQADLVTLSSRTAQVVAYDSAHGITKEPELVFDAIWTVFPHIQTDSGEWIP